MTLVKLHKKDPLRRNVEKGEDDQGLSPMAPPDGYAPPGKGQFVPREQLHPFLQSLWDEHRALIDDLRKFEGILQAIQETGVSREVDRGLRDFFMAVDEKLIPHNRREEHLLFPLLAKRLEEHGEHSKQDEPTTGVDVLEHDHLQFIQRSAVVLNFLGMAGRLPDEASRLLMFDAAIEQGKVLVEQVRLHIFREDNIIFALAHEYITSEEFDRMQQTDG